MVGFHLTKGMGKAKAKTKTKAKVISELKAELKTEVKKPTKTKTVPLPAPDVHLMQGDFVDGVVTSIATKGVMVNIGAETLGTLVVSAELKKEFQKGDRVQGMKIEKIHPTSGAVILSMEDPELEVDEMVAPKAKAKLKEKVKSKAKMVAK